TLVMAGRIVMDEAKKQGVRILPVDSEHSAIFQSLAGHRADEVRRIILTASGGPFLRLPLERLDSMTPEEALKHPNWTMGAKVTIDSATLLNKGLEVIEASWLFGISSDRITVSIHPQSIVHSMVEYIDGSIVAQLSTPDMKGPIAYALSYPERIETGAKALDLSRMNLEFMEPEKERFPCLFLCYSALHGNSTMPAVLNAADEVAVSAFLERRIPFTDIYRIIASVMERHTRVEADSIEAILSADRWARQEAEAIINTEVMNK
ncbi:MAG: 1-deoxy-D-xylulose-5-phosphate reductoisomerase, partial [Deltaproteobacteria bacterium]|nr:1-deoxy-D-xylulose-5-phosphate reductoisomerase [Deltaproteobacteria bacterium]